LAEFAARREGGRRFFIGARGAIIAYAKAISGTGRLTESQLKTETANLPDPTVPSDVREMQFNRFQRNIDQVCERLAETSRRRYSGCNPCARRRTSLRRSGYSRDIAARESARTGQYRNAKGYAMKAGQESLCERALHRHREQNLRGWKL